MTALFFFFGAVLLMALLCYLDHRFGPRCERHGAKVYVSKVPSLGCQTCIQEDMAEFHENQRRQRVLEHADAIKTAIRSAGAELTGLTEDQVWDLFMKRLKEFCEVEVPQAHAALDKLERKP